MLNLKKYERVNESQWKLTLSFRLFGLEEKLVEKTLPNKDAVDEYLRSMKHDTLRHNIEYFVNAHKEQTAEEKKHSVARALAGIAYMWERECGLRECAELVIKMEKRLFDILESSKESTYKQSLKDLNAMIKFCKAECA